MSACCPCPPSFSSSAYGVGKRIDLPSTRNIIHRILDGSVRSAPCETHPVFGLKFPTRVEGVNPTLLNPRSSWKSAEAYDATAAKLAKQFVDNYHKFKAGSKFDYSKHGPVA